jgi:hypothetical protein
VRKKMANSVATLSRRLCRSLLPNAKPASHYLSSMSFSTDNLSDLDEFEKAALNSDPDSDPPLSQQSSPSQPPKERIVYDHPLENGLDVGIYKVRSLAPYHYTFFSLVTLLLLLFSFRSEFYLFIFIYIFFIFD